MWIQILTTKTKRPHTKTLKERIDEKKRKNK